MDRTTITPTFEGLVLWQLPSAPRIKWSTWRRTEMRRLISLLLIPLVIVSQSFALFAHDHSSGRTSGPADHNSRPHFHSHAGSGHRHHHPHEHPHRSTTTHNHQDATTSHVAATDSHESDAVYVSTSTPHLIQRHSSAERTVWLQQLADCLSAMSADDLVEMPHSHGAGVFSQTQCAHRSVAFESLSLRI